MKELSEILLSAIHDGIGSVVLECVCGRMHFGNGRDMEDGEHDRLMAKAKEKPDRYIPTNDDSVSAQCLFGHPRVVGCPCGWEKRTSETLWENRKWIINFFNEVAKAQALQAAKDTELLKVIDP